MIPKKTKYKKYQKQKLLNKIKTNNGIFNFSFGSFALVAKKYGILKEKEIEAGRRLISKKIKSKGKLWVTVFAHLPKTAKPTEVRMGKGKGSIALWVAKIKAGMPVYELDGITESLAVELLELCNTKLSICLSLKKSYINYETY